MGTVSNPWEKGKFLVGQWCDKDVERHQRLFVSACGIVALELWNRAVEKCVSVCTCGRISLVSVYRVRLVVRDGCVMCVV